MITDFDSTQGDHIELIIDRSVVGSLFDQTVFERELAGAAVGPDALGIQVQSDADLSSEYQGLVFDTQNQTLYFDTGGSGFEIAEIHGGYIPKLTDFDFHLV